MKTLKALIWDVDGTLAETEDEGHRVAFNLAFEEAGLPWRWDSAIYGELLAVTGGKERLHAWWWRADPQGATGAEHTIRQLHARKTAHYVDLVRKGAIPLRPGVKALLDEAQARGLRQAIATTTTMDNVVSLLDVALGPDGMQRFEAIGAGDVVAKKKPAPDIYRWVLDKLKLPAHECLAVEDSLPGARAAQAAGIPVLLVRSRYTGATPIGGCVDDLSTLEGVGLDGLITRWEQALAAS